MKKKLFLPLFLVALLGAVVLLKVLFPNQTIPKDWRTYEVLNGFRLSLPPDWELDKSEEDLVTVRSYKLPPASVSDKGYFYQHGEATVALSTIPNSKGFDSIEKWLSDFKNSKESKAKEVNRVDYTMGGRRGKRLVWESPRDGQRTTIYYLLLPNRKTILVASVYGNPSESNEQTVQKVLGNLRLP